METRPLVLVAVIAATWNITTIKELYAPTVTCVNTILHLQPSNSPTLVLLTVILHL